HMASLWEIDDLTNLRYNRDLGVTGDDDSGSGPPTFMAGWIRTGSTSFSGSVPGRANCNLWASSSGGAGTNVFLPAFWFSPPDGHDLTVIDPWVAITHIC